MLKRFSTFMLALLILITVPSPANAEEGPRGLTISPVRQELTVQPGKATPGSFIVGNSTENPITIQLSVEEFSVTDYDYNYEFRAPPDKSWVKLRQQQIELGPNKTQKVFFDVVVPKNTPPGGYYFSLFASTTVQGPGLPGTVRAASLLYAKVDGDLVRTSVLENASVPFLITGDEVPYEFDIRNTGNVHFSAYFYGQLETVFGPLPETGTSHLLMPGTVRTIKGTVPAPSLPGLYKVTYGYRVDFADIVTSKSKYVLFVPPWSLAATAVLGYVAWRLWKMRHRIAMRVKRN